MKFEKHVYTCEHPHLPVTKCRTVLGTQPNQSVIPRTICQESDLDLDWCSLQGNRLHQQSTNRQEGVCVTEVLFVSPVVPERGLKS